MHKQHPPQAGVTLIELVTWLALIALLLAAVGAIFWSATKSWSYGNAQYDMQQTARFVTNTMTSDLLYGISNKPKISTGLMADPTITYPSVMFTSRKDGLNIKKTYYLDTSDHKLYLKTYGTEPAKATITLVKGQTKDSILLPIKGKTAFAITPTSVTINLQVDTTKNTHQKTNEKAKPFEIHTTVTLLDSFLK